MRRALRIAHVIATNFFGGPEKQLIEHARRVDKERFSLAALSFRERAGSNDFVRRAQDEGMPVHELPSRIPFDARAVARLAGLIKSKRIDLLCTHGYKATVIGRMASGLAGAPQIAFSRGWTGENRKIRLYEQLDRWCLRHADHVVAVSQKQRERVLSLGVPAGKVSVVYNCIDVDGAAALPRTSLRREFGLRADDIVVAAAGRLSPEKNFGMLLDAAQLAAKKDGRLQFVVFGEGALREGLEEKRARSGLDSRFLLPGFRKDIMSLIADADIFVLPSLTEGLPNVVLEACALKKPVIATAVGGTPEVVRHGITGFLVSPDETKRMAGYLVRLARNPELAAAMGLNGHDFVRRHFTFEHQTAQLERLYGEVYASFYYRRNTGQE